MVRLNGLTLPGDDHELHHWLQTHSPIVAVVVAALPPLSVLETLTFDAILDQHSGTVMKTVKAFGSDRTTAEAEEIVCRLAGLMERPAFRIGHYELHC